MSAINEGWLRSWIKNNWKKSDKKPVLNVDLWQKYILRWNETLPEIPLYSNVYTTIHADWLEGYTQSSLWDFNQAVLYASIKGAE